MASIRRAANPSAWPSPVAPPSGEAEEREETGDSAEIATDTASMGRGCARGIHSAARLAAWMPAMRAVAKTSPFSICPSVIRARVSGAIRTSQRAMQTR